MKLRKAFASGAGREAIRWVLGLILLGAVGFYIADRFFDRTDEDVEQLRVTADSAIKASHSKDSIISGLRSQRNELRDRVVSDSGIMVGLRVQRDGLTVTTRGLRRDLAKAKTKTDTIRLYVKTIQTQDSTIKVCALEVETCLQMGERLDSIIQSQDTEIGVVTSDRDSLRVILGDLVDVTHDCKNGRADLLLFKFCKPSQTVTFIVGALAGGTLTCWATGCLSDEPQTIVVQNYPEEY